MAGFDVSDWLDTVVQLTLIMILLCLTVVDVILLKTFVITVFGCINVLLELNEVWSILSVIPLLVVKCFKVLLDKICDNVVTFDGISIFELELVVVLKWFNCLAVLVDLAAFPVLNLVVMSTFVSNAALCDVNFIFVLNPNVLVEWIGDSVVHCDATTVSVFVGVRDVTLNRISGMDVLVGETTVFMGKDDVTLDGIDRIVVPPDATIVFVDKVRVILMAALVDMATVVVGTLDVTLNILFGMVVPLDPISVFFPEFVVMLNKVSGLLVPFNSAVVCVEDRIELVELLSRDKFAFKDVQIFSVRYLLYILDKRFVNVDIAADRDEDVDGVVIKYEFGFGEALELHVFWWLNVNKRNVDVSIVFDRGALDVAEVGVKYNFDPGDKLFLLVCLLYKTSVTELCFKDRLVDKRSLDVESLVDNDIVDVEGLVFKDDFVNGVVL